MPTKFLLLQNPTKICPTVITFPFWFLPKFCNFLTLVQSEKEGILLVFVGRILVIQQCLQVPLCLTVINHNEGHQDCSRSQQFFF